MASALSRGSKVVVMARAEWEKHPKKMFVWGNDRWMPALYQRKGSPINVQFNS